MSSVSKPNPLKKQCLNCVVKYFDKLIDSYDAGSGVIPQKHFEFLQRVYSKVLLDRLTDQNCLKDKHLNFLINPYLKELDLRSRSFADPTAIIERLKVVGNNITCLYLQEQYYVEDIIEIINCVPHVEELHCAQTESRDRVLEAIGKNCKQLSVLDMSPTDSGLKSLCVKRKNGDFMPNMLLKKIQNIDNLSSEGIKFCLKNFPNLEILDTYNVASTIYLDYKKRFHRRELQNQPKYKLTQLDIIDFYISEMADELRDALLVCAMLCPNVTVLKVDDLSTPSSVMACRKFTQLLEVELRALHPQNFTPFLIARGASLISLTLSCGTVFLNELAKSCQNLESLFFKDIKIDSSSSDETTVLSKLTSITLYSYEMEDVEVEPIISLLKASPKTEVLHLPCCRLITDQFVSSLLACKCMANIQKLDLSFSYLTEASARKCIFSMPSLKEINIDGCVTRKEYKSLLDSVRTESLGVDVVFNSLGYDIDYGYPIEYPTRDYESNVNTMRLMNHYEIDDYDIDVDVDVYDNYDIDVDVDDYDNYDIDYVDDYY